MSVHSYTTSFTNNKPNLQTFTTKLISFLLPENMQTTGTIEIHQCISETDR